MKELSPEWKMSKAKKPYYNTTPPLSISLNPPPILRSLFTGLFLKALSDNICENNFCTQIFSVQQKGC